MTPEQMRALPELLTARDLLAQIEATYNVSKLIAAAQRQDAPPTESDYAIIDALLSQPTPTAEFRPDWMPEYVASLLRQKERSDRVLAFVQTQTGVAATIVESILVGSFDGRDLPIQPAEPPRIEDMTPGTTFTARRYGGKLNYRWVTATGTRLWMVGKPMYCSTSDIDPSTIRDVTPAKEGDG